MDTQGNKQNDKHDESFRDHINTINDDGRKSIMFIQLSLKGNIMI
jgi:hypothetical protein